MTVASLFTVAEACEKLKISRPTFYKELHSGLLQTFKIGSRRFVTDRALANYLDKLEKHAAPPRWPAARAAVSAKTEQKATRK